MYTTKHSRLTIAAKTLKESAVIRLMNRLRYTLDNCKDIESLSRDLALDSVPRRILLERGVQAMLAAIEGNILQASDTIVETMAAGNVPMATITRQPSEPLVTDKTPVYYIGKQDYGSMAALDKISIGRPQQALQSEAKHRTHRHALLELLSGRNRPNQEKGFLIG